MREFTRQTRYLQKSGTSGQEREEGRRTRGSSDPFVFRDRKSGGARCLPGSLATTRGRSCERKCSSLASREGPSQTCRGCVFSGRVSAVRGRLSNGANRYSRRASFSHLTRRPHLPAKRECRFFAWTSPAQRPEGTGDAASTLAAMSSICNDSPRRAEIPPAKPNEKNNAGSRWSFRVARECCPITCTNCEIF